MINILTINDGRSELWQWDTGRKLTVEGECSQVHFSNKLIGRSIDVDVVDGEANIPDILLQTDKDLTAWAFIGSAENGYTKVSKTFKVNARNKPVGYVFTRSEQITLSGIDNRLKRLEETQTPDAIKDAVDEYMKENPVDLTKDGIYEALEYVPAPWQAVNAKVGLPSDGESLDYGEEGQVAASDGQGNITWVDQGVDPQCYTTEREGGNQANPSADDIWNLYEALASANEDRVTVSEVTNTDGTFTNKVYTFSVGDYNEPVVRPEDNNGVGTGGRRGIKDVDVKKPKYLVMSGIHGEQAAALSVYRFFRDLMEKKNLPEKLRQGAIFSVMPIASPSAFDADSRLNDAGYDVNRNFDYNWDSKEGTDRPAGTAAESEKETQAIVSWLKANTDAELFIDCHNGSATKVNGVTEYTINEVAMLVGLNDNESVKRAKKIAMRGLDRVIPYWRDEIKYDEHNMSYDTEELWQPVFAYSSYVDDTGLAVYYAADKLQIPSIALELTTLANAGVNEIDAAYPHTPETISVGAEALGNILLEFYEQHIGNNKPELPPLGNGDVEYGKEGQFAVSDGKGGIKWLTVFTAEEVGF